MKKPTIPALGHMDRSLREFLAAVKENIEIIEGRRRRIEPLSPGVAAADIVAKVNEILARLQD